MLRQPVQVDVNMISPEDDNFIKSEANSTINFEANFTNVFTNKYENLNLIIISHFIFWNSKSNFSNINRCF